MTPTTQPSAEKMLTEIITAQVTGGCDKWDIFGRPEPHPDIQGAIEGGLIFHILLDPETLRAAYGTEKKVYRFDFVHATGEELERSHWAGRAIFNAWYAGGTAKAIEMAFQLLP